jgi:hypothetical protein
MKRLIMFLMIATLFSIVTCGQYAIYTKSFSFNDMTGTDTAFYYPVFPSSPKGEILAGPWSVSVIDALVESEDLFCAIGVAAELGDFKELTISNWPYECGTSTNTVNGVTTHGRAATGDNNAFRYLVIKYYKATAETITTENDIVYHKILMFR